jgi:putative tricarboxylic transport membrane protein
MESLQHLLTGLSIAATPINLLYCFLGCLAGTLVGVLPGIGPQGAIALILPATFHLPPVSAIIMFAGILYGAMYGGSTTSILVNIPGESASIITCVDGHKMALQGRAGPALGIAAFGSFIAGTLCLFGLVFMAPILAEYCLSFGPPEFFALMIFALSTLIYLAQGSMAKGLMMALLGLMLANIGLDLVTGTPRFVYDLLSLRDGLGLVPMVIGLFGVSEILLTIEKGIKAKLYQAEIKSLLPTRQDWKDSIFPITRGTALGFFLGMIPGLSFAVSTFLSYTLEKKISKHPERFGNGAIEGVAAPEACNNAGECGTMIPMLSLGIPAGASTSMVLGAMMIYGITPGPLLIKNSPEVFWGVIGSMYIGNVMLLVLNLPLIPLWVLIGSYCIANSTIDMLIMLAFGLAGYVLRKFEYEIPPLIMGFVLGPMLEKALRRSLIMSHGSFSIFFNRPISMVLMGMGLLLLVSPLLTKKRLAETIPRR